MRSYEKTIEPPEQSTDYEIPTIIDGGDIIEEPQKIYVAGVAVTLLNERVQHLGSMWIVVGNATI